MIHALILPCAPIESKDESLSQRLTLMVERPDHHQQENRANDRQKKSGGMKERTILGPGENPRDQAADNRAADAHAHGEPEAHVISHDGVGNESDDETDNDGPDDVEHEGELVRRAQEMSIHASPTRFSTATALQLLDRPLFHTTYIVRNQARE